MPPKIKLNLKKAGTKQQQANANKFLQEKQARQQREQQDKEAAAQLYETFVESFEKGGSSEKTQFVRGGTINPQDSVQNVFGLGEEDDEEGEGNDKAGDASSTPRKNASNHQSEGQAEQSSTGTSNGQKNSVGSEMDRMMQEMKHRVADPKAGRGTESRGRRSSSPKQQQPTRSTKRPPRAEKKGKTREIDKLMEEIKETSPADSGAGRKAHTVTTSSGRRITLPEGDPNSTNIYVGNLAPTVTEEYLSKKFGKFGELISVKVMWPRNEEEKARGRNTGFVAFNTREQAVDAMASMWDSEIAGQTLKLGWGKPISGARGTTAPGSVNPRVARAGRKRSSDRSPSRSSSDGSSSEQHGDRRRSRNRRRRSRSRSSSGSSGCDRYRKRRRSQSPRRRSPSPIRGRNNFREDEESPRYSSNERTPKKRNAHHPSHEDSLAEKERAEQQRLYGGPEMPDSAPKIVVRPPQDPLRRRHIDRLALYVSKDGQALEDLFISSEREHYNTHGTYNYGFLLERNTPEGIYYRWKTISLVMGDSVKHWRTKPFQLTVGGPWWVPPPLETADQAISKSNESQAGKESSHIAPHSSNERVEYHENADPRMVEDKAYREGSTIDPQPLQVFPPSTERYKRPRNLLGANQMLDKVTGTRSRSGSKRDTDDDAETDINEAWDSGRSWSASDSDCPQNEDDNFGDEETSGDVPHGYTLLSQKEFRKWVRKLRRVSLQRDSICDAMVWALEHASKARSIVDMIRQSMTKRTAPAPTKVARLYLLNDILHNSTASVRNASVYRNAIEDILPVAFEELGWTLRKLYKYAGRITAEAMKNRIQRVLRRWESIGVFPPLFLHGLEATLLWRPDAQPPEEQWENVDESTLNLDDIKQKCKQAGQQSEGLNVNAMLKRIAWVNQFIKKKFSGFDEKPGNSDKVVELENKDWGGSADVESKTENKRAKKLTKRRRNKYAARAGKGSWVSVDETNDAEESSEGTDSDVDGVPLDSEIDGVPIDANNISHDQSQTANSGTAVENDAMEESSDDDEDIDGVPI
eukprot:gb/GECG01000261.1/.p1 GENE.gb/GECG01000261.1/~~gb/GECG01000261.1/.p1  ORF type:complete len:1036 (+),score=168.71 gb/GECG01000261.1/:1-3108(+)